ncbi:ribonuclease D [Streptomyces sp. NPDC089799]|uniref:ribonuclease D n=1 Tax=Streptomyces sp. NPDC089799 TaxID=3155066 RepID=UPI003423A242
MSAPNSIRDVEVGDRVRIVSGDLPEALYSEVASVRRVAWDIETNGLNPLDAQIGTCQLSAPEVGAIVVVDLAGKRPVNLSRLLSDHDVEKVFHHAPFDVSFMTHWWGVSAQKVFCTKIAAKLLNPHGPAREHSLEHLMQAYFKLQLDKSVRMTDWLAEHLSSRQIDYAVMDVLKLLDLHELQLSQLETQRLMGLYERCCAFLPSHVELRLHGVSDPFKY